MSILCLTFSKNVVLCVMKSKPLRRFLRSIRKVVMKLEAIDWIAILKDFGFFLGGILSAVLAGKYRK